MEIKNLKTFLTVAELKSFTKAAETLGYTQSTVSFQINQLEQELNCQLFDRIGHNIYLTSRGQLLLNHALSINNSVEYLLEDFKQDENPTGQIHMYSSDSICEKMMLLNYAEFYKTYPHINLIFSTGATKDMLEILDRNEADVIFTLDNHIYRQNFIIARESPVKLFFVASKEFPLAYKKDIDIKELIQYPLILTEKGMSYRKVLDDELSKQSIEVTPVLETGRTDIIINSLKSGVNASFLPEFAIKESIEAGTLVKLDVKDFDLTIWKQLIYRKDKWISLTLKSFIDFVIEHEFEW